MTATLQKQFVIAGMPEALSKLTNDFDKYYLGTASKISNHSTHIAVDQELLYGLDENTLLIGSLVVLVRSNVFLPAGVTPQKDQWVLDELLVGRLRGFASEDAVLGRCAILEPLQVKIDFELVGRYKMVGERPHYSRDTGNVFGPNNWHIFLPSVEIQEFIVNGTLGSGFKINLGALRRTESDLDDRLKCQMMIHVPDIRGKRTAMFGKTRLGKSNAVKLVMESMLLMTASDKNVGQLVFDVNGEYANDNPQDGNTSIATMYSDRCQVYYLAHRSSDANMGANRKYIRYNFYERTQDCTRIMGELLDKSVLSNDDLQYFLQLNFPDFIHFVLNEEPGLRARRTLRKIHLLWTVLFLAGFGYSESHLLGLTQNRWKRVDLFITGFSDSLRMAMYQAIEGRVVPRNANNMEELAKEMLVYSKFVKQYKNDPNLMEAGVSMVDKDDLMVIRFLNPDVGAGLKVLSTCVPYHAANATDFEKDIIKALDDGKTIIMDLGSANEGVLRFFSSTLSIAVFRHQESKFVSNSLGNRFVQLYFEEAHMIFPPSMPGKVTDIYSRFAKEGAKFNIGIVYSTQSPSSVNPELLSQTENFFIGHLSNTNEVALLGEVQYAFANAGDYILQYREPGYMHVLTYSNRYVIPVQVRRFNGAAASDKIVIQAA